MIIKPVLRWDVGAALQKSYTLGSRGSDRDSTLTKLGPADNESWLRKTIVSRVANFCLLGG